MRKFIRKIEIRLVSIFNRRSRIMRHKKRTNKKLIKVTRPRSRIRNEPRPFANFAEHPHINTNTKRKGLRQRSVPLFRHIFIWPVASHLVDVVFLFSYLSRLSPLNEIHSKVPFAAFRSLVVPSVLFIFPHFFSGLFPVFSFLFRGWEFRLLSLNAPFWPTTRFLLQSRIVRTSCPS